MNIYELFMKLIRGASIDELLRIQNSLGLELEHREDMKKHAKKLRELLIRD